MDNMTIFNEIEQETGSRAIDAIIEMKDLKLGEVLGTTRQLLICFSESPYFSETPKPCTTLSWCY